jgi:hypothetical protein
MGMAVGDYDGDGDFDWFVTSIFGSFLGSTGNRLYSCVGGRNFLDVTTVAGVREGGWGWGATFLDFDNDRDLDLLMVNGASGVDADATTLWRNDGAGSFANVTGEGSGVTDAEVATGLVSFDLENDGDLDVVVVNNGGAPILYRNDGGNDNDWLKLRLIGTRSNRDAVGAVIRIRVGEGEGELLRFVDGGSNYLGHNERIVHVGLGAEEVGMVAEVEILWPSGFQQVVSGVATNELVTIVEPAGQSLVLDRLTLDEGRSEVTTVWRTEAGSRCVMESSDDLRTWHKVEVLEATQELITWREFVEGGLPERRFYRAWR